ncbi:MAG: septal ring-binding cell division protein DamX [Pseudomonadales bacterium]|jgi:septal ring-binding cell division protein DamX
MLTGLGILTQASTYAQSDWNCDKTDANWNCAEKETTAKQSTEKYSTAESTTANDGVSSSQEGSYSASNNQDLDSLARPSKFAADAYSIQLLASGSRDKIIGLIKEYRIPSLIIEYTTAEQTLYLWITGTYPNKTDAQIEIDRLPVLPPNITPWVRPTNTIAAMPVLVRAKL